MAEPGEQFIAAFLDQVAEFFDNETPVSPDSLFTDPTDGEAITARGLLERIRLGKLDPRQKPICICDPEGHGFDRECPVHGEREADRG